MASHRGWDTARHGLKHLPAMNTPEPWQIKEADSVEAEKLRYAKERLSAHHQFEQALREGMERAEAMARLEAALALIKR